jgi:hypothetical protein
MKPILASAVFLLAAGTAAHYALAQDAGKSRIVVGPNILVSRDGDIAHCETMIAANPRNPKNLLGGSTVMFHPDGGGANKPYVSFDGGSSWEDIVLPHEAENESGDQQVGFGISGTAYFVSLSLSPKSPGMQFYRSEDGGRTWGKPIDLGNHHDHEMLITDYTYGPYAGRVYITDETDVPGSREMETMEMKRRVVLFRSSDDGRSFIGPIEVARGNNTGLAAQNLLVLSDGTIFIPMDEYPNYNVNKDADTWHMVFSTSSDGGVTFSPVQTIGNIYFGGSKTLRKQQRSGRVDQMGMPAFAVDTEGKFRDRLYASWIQLEGERFRLVLSWSADRGKTWSKPKLVDPNISADASQYQQMVAVNPEGVLGVFWYSTEGFPKGDQFHVYFTASTDGGETFLPKKRVSNESSRPFGAGDLRPGPFVSKERDMVLVDFVSGVSRWVDGGDYIGLTASGEGIFHPFWADGRNGTYQLYTAAIQVPTSSAPPATIEKVAASLTEKMTLVFDPVLYNDQTREAWIPVRLKNISKETLYPPFQVEIKELVHPFMAKTHEEADVPVILDASNGKQGVGAAFDYSRALGDLEALPPDGVTSAVLWKLQAASAVKTSFHVGADITGYVKK